MEQLIPDQPTSAVPVYTKSQKRHMRVEKKQNKIEFNPKEMYKYRNEAHQRKVERVHHCIQQRNQQDEELFKERKKMASAAKRDAQQRGMQILRQVKQTQQMTAQEIKERLSKIQCE